MAKAVRLNSLKELETAMMAYAHEAEHAVVKAIYSATDYGEVILTRAASTKRRQYRGLGNRVIRRKISTTGEHKDGYGTQRMKDGAVVFNDVPHAVYVDIGRSPGRPPPFKKLLKWVKLKRFNHKRLVGMGPLAARSSLKRIRWSKGEKESIIAELDAKLARLYQRRIAKYGTRPAWFMRDAAPKVTKRMIKDFRENMRKLNGDPPRKRRSSKRPKK